MIEQVFLTRDIPNKFDDASEPGIENRAKPLLLNEG